MAKTFGDLKIGDFVYSLATYPATSPVDKINCKEAYDLLGMGFELVSYPAISEKIALYEVKDIKPYPYGDHCVSISLVYERGTTIINAEINDKTCLKKYLTSSHYQVFSVDIDSLKEKMSKIIHAMKAVNKNLMIAKSNKYKEMLKKIETL
jgi:hypothetical protein